MQTRFDGRVRVTYHCHAALALALGLLVGNGFSQSLVQEGWQKSTCGTYVPQSATDTFIQGDVATWVIGDTASQCGPSGNKAEIVCAGTRKYLRLTTVTNLMGCAENIWAAPINGPSIAITPSTFVALTETGSLVDPQWGGWHSFPTCCPPPDDCVFLKVVDTSGNTLVYLFQRSPDYVPHTTTLTVSLPTGGIGEVGYHEIFLDAWDTAGGSYVRNLYNDFQNVPLFSAANAHIGELVFELTSVGTTTMDDLQFGAVSITCPRITSQPADATTTNGGALTLSVTADGTSPLTYQWRQNGTPLNGATSASLALANTTAATGGGYDVVVCNACGCVTSRVASVTILGAPLIVSQPASRTVALGSNALFCVSAIGAPPLRYQWWQNGAPVANGGRVSGADTACLAIAAVQFADAADLTVVVANAFGSVTSTVATLTVQLAPNIVLQPFSITARPGVTVMFSVAAAGADPLAYRWQKNGTNLSDGSRISGTSQPTLSIGSLATNDAGSYSVVVSNLVGTVRSSNAVLRVDGTRPTVSVTNLTAGQRISNAVYTVRGAASDNTGVSNIWYQINGGDWTLAQGTNPWAAPLQLDQRSNTFRVYAYDIAGNQSTTTSIAFLFIRTDTLQVRSVGVGTLSPNYSSAVLEVGQSYTMVATGTNGHQFSQWQVTSNWVEPPAVVLSNKLSFIMQSNLTLTAVFLDTNRPTVAITNLATNQRISNAVYTVRGTNNDNRGVSNVWYQLNGGAWTLAQGTNPWAAPLQLDQRSNTFRVYAEDAAGNRSVTNAVAFLRVFTALLVVQIDGLGTVKSNYNGQRLEVGNAYSMTATQATGYAFTNWTDGAGAFVTNKPTVSFVMRSNLVLQANFVDVQIPVLTITAPTNGARLSNAVATVRGTVSDNGPLGLLHYQYAGGNWQTALASSNWSVTLLLASGTNTFRAFAADAAGNRSVTNSRNLVCALSHPTNTFRITVLDRTPTGWHLGMSDGQWGSNRVVQGSSNLLDWTTVFTNLSTNTWIEFLDTSASNAPRRFFRLVLP